MQAPQQLGPVAMWTSEVWLLSRVTQRYNAIDVHTLTLQSAFCVTRPWGPRITCCAGLE